MRSIRFTHASLVAGLALGMMAVWAGAAPIGAVGDLVTGGWAWCYTQEEVYVAATYAYCDPCDDTVVRYCFEGSDFGGPCSGGMITVVVAASAGATPHASGGGSCYGSVDCEKIHDGACY